MLVAALAEAAAAMKILAEHMSQVTGQAVRVEITATGSDEADADAIKRGQKPQTIEAVRKALGV